MPDDAWQARDGALTAQVHLATLRPDGSLDVPRGLHVVLEVGANSRNTLDRELLPRRPDTFLVTFEPLLDKYAALLARNSRPDVRATLGAHHPRGLVLPFALSSDHNAIRQFKISGRTDGCASLLNPVSSYYSQDCTNLTGVLERRNVPSVSLQVVLREAGLVQVAGPGLRCPTLRSPARLLTEFSGPVFHLHDAALGLTPASG